MLMCTGTSGGTKPCSSSTAPWSWRVRRRLHSDHLRACCGRVGCVCPQDPPLALCDQHGTQAIFLRPPPAAAHPSEDTHVVAPRWARSGARRAGSACSSPCTSSASSPCRAAGQTKELDQQRDRLAGSRLLAGASSGVADQVICAIVSYCARLRTRPYKLAARSQLFVYVWRWVRVQAQTPAHTLLRTRGFRRSAFLLLPPASLTRCAQACLSSQLLGQQLFACSPASHG